MKKIGIVGGVAWPSTVDYYSGICRKSEQWHLARQLPGIPSTPEMSIESLDLSKAFAWLGTDGDEDSWSQFDNYHRAALQRLQASGVDFALIASNTPHHRFESIVRGISIPVIGIFDEAAKESARIGATGVLILGTALTMSSAVFRDKFARYGIAAAGPGGEAARSMTAALIQDLQQGKLDGAGRRVDEIARISFADRFKAKPLVCLACTELPLAFPEHKMLPTFECGGIVYLNTTAIHIDAAFDFAVDR
ncbi:MAG TPA: aspartate/glutamate racemase family protein [Terracidiphilus sp.]